ncbi:MAG: DUF1439 domain-containing protein [Chitinivibrionales bacterium]|nr:DUF1439 domain-containing protein [Chitinivibrionales bacterium]
MILPVKPGTTRMARNLHLNSPVIDRYHVTGSATMKNLPSAILYALLTSLVLLGMLLFFCGKPSIEVKIPAAEVRRDLQKKFPETRTYAAIAQVTLQNPTLLLARRKDKLTIGLEVVLSPRGLGAVEVEKGRIVFTSGLAFDPSKGTFYLENTNVDSIVLDLSQLDTRVQRGIKEVIRIILGENIEGSVVRRLEPGSLRTPIAKLFIRKVNIREEGIVVTLGF